MVAKSFTVALLVVATFLVGCGDEKDKPFLQFSGGGFIFNYRLATADYGFVARVVKELPEGSVIEATFDNPAGGPPIVIVEKSVSGSKGYMFRTPSLTGIKANYPYKVVLRLLAAKEGVELARYERTYKSDLDQSVLPDQPLTVGPGYHQPPNKP